MCETKFYDVTYRLVGEKEELKRVQRVLNNNPVYNNTGEDNPVLANILDNAGAINIDECRKMCEMKDACFTCRLLTSTVELQEVDGVGNVLKFVTMSNGKICHKLVEKLAEYAAPNCKICFSAMCESYVEKGSCVTNVKSKVGEKVFPTDEDQYVVLNDLLEQKFGYDESEERDIYEEKMQKQLASICYEYCAGVSEKFLPTGITFPEEYVFLTTFGGCQDEN